MRTERPRVQFLDDEPAVLDGLRRRLQSAGADYTLTFCTDPHVVLEQVMAGRVDVLVSDISMPGCDGFELLARVRASAPGQRIPVIFLTGRQDIDFKRRALDMDAIDLVNKPVVLEDLLARLRSVLRLKAYEDQLHDQNAELERRVRARTEALAASQREIGWRLAKAGELRDANTGDHVVRVGLYSRQLGLALGLSEAFVEQLLLAAPLHDVGKLGVPDAVLRKRGPLDPSERAQMEEHCRIGAAILLERPELANRVDAFEDVGASADNPLLAMAARIAHSHHEHWDGGGYPEGIRGERIPLEARIAAVADVFDAMCSVRPYKPASAPDDVRAEIVAHSGRQFDPQVVAAFQRSFAEFCTIAANSRTAVGDPARGSEIVHESADPVRRR